MELGDDLQFLKLDNANLLKEVQSLRLQSDLLRERNNDLESKLRQDLGGGTARQSPQKMQIDSRSVHLGKEALLDIHPIPREGRLDNPKESQRVHDKGSALVHLFDIRPPQNGIQQTPPAGPGINELRRARDGPHLIGEAPRATPDLVDKTLASENNPSTVVPPSPVPSHSEDLLRRLPSLLSVRSPVSGVALPDVASSLLQLKLIRQDTHDSPAAIASFLEKLTQTAHPPQTNYRAAFTAALRILIPLLGPPGTLPLEWLNFLNDFPSRIPHTQRDSIVSIPWPDSGVSVTGISPSLLQAPPRQLFTHPHNSHGANRRSRSLDNIPSPASPIPTGALPAPPCTPYHRSPGPHSQAPQTGVPRCERDAWVLLLALAYAAFPSSRVATKLRKLPVTVKLQMIAWLPPGVNVYANMHFVSTTADEALEQFWDFKKEILRLKHGWP